MAGFWSVHIRLPVSLYFINCYTVWILHAVTGKCQRFTVRHAICCWFPLRETFVFPSWGISLIYWCKKGVFLRDLVKFLFWKHMWNPAEMASIYVYTFADVIVQIVQIPSLEGMESVWSVWSVWSVCLYTDLHDINDTCDQSVINMAYGVYKY